MKKISYLFGLAAILMFGCTQPYVADDVSEQPEVPVQENLTVPTSFNQKVLVDEYTATWCGYCPSMPITLQTYEHANPDRVYVNAVHLSDEMLISENDVLANLFNISGIPSIIVNRIPNSYTSNITNALQQDAVVGVAINSVVNDKNQAAIAVHAGFAEDITQQLTLSVMLVEDGLIYDQVSFYNDDVNSLFYQLGETLEDYNHKNVIREFLTEALGDEIPATATKAGTYYTQEFIVDISPYKLENLSIVAVVGLDGENQSNNGLFNVQKCAVGSGRGWE